jgi:hypothetical protein
MAADDESTGGSAAPEPPPRPFPGFETEDVAERRAPTGRVRLARRRSRHTLVATLAVALAIGTAGAVLLMAGTPDPSGQILQPESGTSVPADSDARGVLSEIPDDRDVWLVVRDRGQVVRAGYELPARDARTYPWRVPLRLRGAEGVVSLELYVTGSEGSALLRDGLTSRPRAEILAIPDAERLDTVRNVRVRR